MSRVCQVTGKKPMKGHYVSHANNKTICTFDEPPLPALLGGEPEPLGALRVSTAGLRHR